MIGPIMSLGTAALMRSLGARRRRVELPGGWWVVNELGPPDGEPWLLLHGMGSTSLGWAKVARHLRRDCTVLIPELSTLGGSRPAGHALNVQDGVEAARALLRVRFPGRATTVAGISLGGWIATRLALAHPELVERLLLVNCAGYRNQDWDRIQQMVSIDSLEGVDRLYDALFHRTPLPLRFTKRGLLAAYRSPSVRRVIETVDYEDSFDAEDLARLSQPVSLVWADSDGLFDVEVAREMAASLRTGRLEVVARCGHGIQWEQPRALVDATLRFRAQTAT